MKRWNSFLFAGMVICLFSPTALWAVDEQIAAIEYEEPTFQNAAQLERALNLTSSSFTEDDMQDAKDQAEEEATKQIDGLAKDHADSVVDQISSDHADSVVDEKSSDHADRIVEETSLAYATEQADLSGFPEGSREYNAVKRQAYNDAKDRATAEGDWENLWETTYNEAYARATAEGDWENLWETTYNQAYARATAEGDWENAWETAYNYAIERATNPNYSNAYQAAYQKALETEVANINGKTLQDIYEMRYVEKLGWGVIAKRRLHLHPSHNGLGNKWKHNTPPSIDDVEIPSGPEDPGAFPLEEEIAAATQRNVRSGWNDDPEFQVKGNKGKGNKKIYGLAQTSGLASDKIRGKSYNRKGNKGGFSSNSSSGGKGNKGGFSSNSSSGGKGNKGGFSSNSSSGGKGNKGRGSGKSSSGGKGNKGRGNSNNGKGKNN